MAQKAGSILKNVEKKEKKIKKETKVAVDLAGLVKSGISGALKAGGGLLGGMVGMSSAGSEAGAWLSKVTGFGDYHIESNSLVSRGVPSFVRNGQRTFISHREYIGDITGSTGFVVSSYALNPGNPLVFPWLSSVAACYQQYKFKGIMFEFCTSSATAVASTNTALGSVIMATNYNVARPNYSSKLEMESSEWSCRTIPCENLIHPIECAPSEGVLNEQYVRTGPVPSGQDARFYDLGNFQLATSGMQAASTIGELWVTYEVELLKPRLPNQLLGPSLAWGFRKGTTYSNADPFNSGGLSVALVGGLPITVNNLVITFAPIITTGSFLVTCWWIGASTALAMAGSTLSNCSLNTEYYGGVGQAVNSGTTTNAFNQLVVNIAGYLAAGSTITLAANTLPATGTAFQLFIEPCPTLPNSSPY